MIARRPPQIRIVLFEPLSDDLGLTNTLLGRATITIDGVPWRNLVVYRNPDHSIAVAFPVTVYVEPPPYPTQLRVACKLKRYVRRLVRASR